MDCFISRKKETATNTNLLALLCVAVLVTCVFAMSHYIHRVLSHVIQMSRRATKMIETETIASKPCKNQLETID